MIFETFFLPRLDLLSFLFFALSVLLSLLFLLVSSLFFDIAEVLPTRAGSSGSDLGRSLRFSFLPLFFSQCSLMFCLFSLGLIQNYVKICQKTIQRERKEEKREERASLERSGTLLERFWAPPPGHAPLHYTLGLPHPLEPPPCSLNIYRSLGGYVPRAGNTL